MRRKDREMDASFAWQVVDKCVYAVLSMTDPEGTPYCVPLSIVRENETIYFHCAKEGFKTECLTRSPQVCLTCVGDASDAPDAFTVYYESAIVRGIACEVSDMAEKRRALELLCQQHTPAHMHAFPDAVSEGLARTAVWRIDVSSITGKCHRRPHISSAERKDTSVKQYTFAPKAWNTNDFIVRVGTARESYRESFLQMEDHISNSYDNARQGYNFVSMLSGERVGAGTVCETTCSFETSGAPLIVFSDEVEQFEDGRRQYGDHFEVVLYKGGCNVWFINLEDGKAKSHSVAKEKFPVETGKPVKLRVEFGDKRLKICADGHDMEVPVENMPEKFYVGITACEGICRFYDFAIDAK